MASVLPKYFLLLSTFFVCTANTAKCVKKDDCTCEMDDGTGTVSLWEIDGGKDGPRYCTRMIEFFKNHFVTSNI